MGGPHRRKGASESTADLSRQQLDDRLDRAYDVCRFALGEPGHAETAVLAALAGDNPPGDDALPARLVEAVSQEAAGEPSAAAPKWPATGTESVDQGRTFIAGRIGQWTVRERLVYALVARNSYSTETVATALGTTTEAVDATLHRLRVGLAEAVQMEVSDEVLRSALPPFDAPASVRAQFYGVMIPEDDGFARPPRRARLPRGMVALVAAIVLIAVGAVLLIVGIAGLLNG